MKVAIFTFIAATSLAVSCSKRELRGRIQKSNNGGSYLVINNDNGGKCGEVLLDGRKWPYPLHAFGQVPSGVHTLECGTKVEFEIKPGTIFQFDYWGP
jgi:hypothetical protein